MTEIKPEGKEKNAGGTPTLLEAMSPKDLLYPKQRAFIDDHSQYKIGVTTRQWGKSTVTSGEATLTVAADTIRPTVLSVGANAAGTQITVTYSEAMDPTSAASAANYTVAGAAPASVTLNGSGTVATLVRSWLALE